MRLGTILRLLRMPHLPAQGLLWRDLQSFVRVHFLYAAASSGLLYALKRPASLADLTRDLRVGRPDLLESLLALGLALGEISLEGGLYRLRGFRARALADRRSDPLVAIVQEYATYHSSVYRELADRLKGAPLGDYLTGTGNLIARSSRALEPFIADFVRMLVAGKEPLKILEVGCGSGIYLKHAAAANPQAWGTGLDMQPDVVAQASRNISRWGIADRFSIMLADIWRLPEDLSGPFDLITLYNNIYYFALDERTGLFSTLLERLESGGRLAIVSVMRGKSVTTNDLDLALRSTIGCTPLPEIEPLRAQLLDAGFDHVKVTRLVPFETYYGLIASRTKGRTLYKANKTAL